MVFALAGCLGSDEDGGDPEEAGDDSTGEQTALSEPTDFPEGEACAVCNMITEEYPEWNAQLVKTDETRVYFCSSGCMLAYITDPEHFGGEDEVVEGVWVTDYDTGELIDGMQAYYVRVKESGHIDDIMGMNPTPFESREAAESLIDRLNDEYDGAYDAAEDVIRFDDFDRDLAMHYRANFFDGDDDDHGHHGDADAPESFDLVDGNGETIDTWVRDHWHTAVTVDESASRSLYAEAVEADGEIIDIDGEHWEFDARLADGAPEDVISIHSHGDHVHIEGETEGLTEVIFEFSHHGEIALTTEADAMVVEVGEGGDHDHGHDDDHDHDHSHDDDHDHDH
ncbi:nitrous oxide reductase accessory protein NosL [Halorubrum vacuolatum]|uniref:Nitrous oxide reductase accessory protein NosL n=1 Tax=Halorubrum vacuolatum TaxID=63740 RepID=A0A238Y3N9_HALVU|nr:nitrous oxide reductase accessory protein NosL [Halorubrum vacuolatum]SNR65273.1 Nitrous oxide reductase accessory protein NosL [Halorubrum vacuolatum]